MARTGRIIHTIAHSVLFVLSSIFAGCLLAFVCDLIGCIAKKGTADEGDLLGLGLSIAILVIFIVIGAIATSVISLVSVTLSAFLIKKSEGKRRVWGIVSLVISIAYVALSAGSFLYVVLIPK